MRFVCKGEHGGRSTIGLQRLQQDLPPHGTESWTTIRASHCASAVPKWRDGEESCRLASSSLPKGQDGTDIASCAAIVQSYWKQQILAIRQDRANGGYVHYETRSKSSVQRKRFERFTAPIVMYQPSSKRPEKSGTSLGLGFIWGNIARPFVKWPTKYLSRDTQDGMAEQVSPYVRGRLDAEERFL
jgi:hypothetical protein